MAHELIADMIGTAYVHPPKGGTIADGGFNCWGAAREALCRLKCPVELPEDPARAMAVCAVRAVDVPAERSAQTGDVAIMMIRDDEGGEDGGGDVAGYRQHVAVCLNAFDAVHAVRGNGVCTIPLNTLRRVSTGFRLVRLVPQPGDIGVPRAKAGTIRIDAYDDVLTRRNRRGVDLVEDDGGIVLVDAVERAGPSIGLAGIVELLTVVNGRVVAPEHWPHTVLRAGDEVVVAPRPADFGTGILIAIAIASAVGSALLAPRVPLSRNEPDRARTARFGRYTSDAVVGDTIPVPFGELKRYGGKTIVKVSGEGPDGDTRIKILIDLGRGPIARIGSLTADTDRVDGAALTGIYFNDQPIANFAGVRVSCRMGTVGQPVIPGFDDTETLHEVGVGGAVLRNSSGAPRTGPAASDEAIVYNTLDAVNAIVPRVRFPRGLFNVSASGQTNTRRVAYRYRTRLTGSGDGGWSAWTVLTLERAEQNEFYSSPRIDNGGVADHHDVQVERVSPEPTSAADVDEMFFDTCKEVIYAENAYEGQALIAFEITASEQLTSPPRVSVDVRGYAGLRIWDGVSDPSSPVFVTGYSANPAWIALEILTNRQWGGGSAYSDDDIDFASLCEWAAYCDEDIPRVSGGGTRKRFRCNIAMREARKAIDWLRLVARTGRCTPTPSGRVWRFIVDRPRPSAVETFTDGSIAVDDGGELQLEYTREETRLGLVRPNRVVAQFENELKEGRSDTIGYPDLGDFWLADEPLREQSVRTEGVTDPEQVAAELVYQMKRTRGLARTVKFTTSKHVPVVQPGDRFDLACSLPGWGLASGRVAAGCTTTSVVLDRTVVIGGGAHTLRVVHMDGTAEDVAVTSVAGTYAAGVSIGVDTMMAAPAEFCEYSIGGAGIHVKPFICARVALVDFRNRLWEVEGIEYAEGIYDDTPGDVTLPDYSTLRSVTTPPGPVEALVAIEREVNGIRQVVLSWRQNPVDAENTGSFRVYRRQVGTTTWILYPNASPTRRQHDIEISEPNYAYQFVVVAVSIGGAALSPDDPRHPIVTLVYGLSQPPPIPPEDLTLTPTGGNTYTLSWSEAPGAVEYQVLFGGVTGTGTHNNGAEDCLVLARTVETELTGLELPPGQSVTFWVRSVASSGRLSLTAASITLASPATPPGESITQTRVYDLENDGGRTNLAWSGGGGGGGRLELVNAASPLGGVWTGPEETGLSLALTEITFRPRTANDAADVPLNTIGWNVPSISADQWGVVSTGPHVVGMLMPPWPDDEQTWLFELRTYSGSTWGPWEPLAPCASVRRVLSGYQWRITLKRKTSPYRPALAGMVVVVTS